MNRFIGERFSIARVNGAYSVIDYTNHEPVVIFTYTTRDEAYLHAVGLNARRHRAMRLELRRAHERRR